MSGPRGGARAATEDAGFTLVELLFAIVLSSLIVGVVAAAMITALNVADSTTDQVGDSNDAGLISSFLVRDAQSAGAIDPATARRDTTLGLLGVTTDASAAGWSGCTKPLSSLVRFSWIDAADRTRPVVVYYSLDGTDGQLTRRICKGGSTVDVVLGSRLSSAVASCDTACDGAPTVVSLALEGSGRRAPFSYTLRASLRGDTQTTPTAGNSSSVPLLALGARTTSPPCVNLALNGTGAVTVRGSAFVEVSCAGTAPISGNQSLLRQAGVGTTIAIGGINDPYARRAAPVGTCASGGTNPGVIGVSATRTTVVVYHQKVTISADTVFQPGRYIFCLGLDMAGGRTTGTDVLWYVKGGTVTLNGAATADLTGRVSGVEANLLLWVATSAQTIQLDGGPRVSSLRGVIYAPTSTLQLSSANAANVGGVVARAVTVAGAGASRVGLPLPVISVLPATVPLGEVTVPYQATLTATGATPPYTWSATGLPPGLVMGATGVIAGTPTAAGTTTAIVTVVDATAQAASFDYVMMVNAAVEVVWPPLGNGEVGVGYPATTMRATLGTAPYVWSATGLPAGLTIGATTGVLSGTPTTAADPATIVVTVTDAMGAVATQSYTVVIHPALVATWPDAVPNVQVGVSSTTTLTATAGAAPYVWTSTGLPPGLSLNPSSGVLSGTPTAAGTYAVVITVTDALGAASTKSFTITVNPPFTATWPLLPGGQVGVTYSTTSVVATGGTTPYTWSATGLPPGLTLGSATGTIAGVPTTAGAFTVTITGTDALGAWVSKPYNITIAAPPTACPGQVAGWRGEYYDGILPAGALVLCRDDAAIDFDWGYGGPAASVDNFSARWTRTQAFTAGTYIFTMGSDDGSRLYVDGALVLDSWGDRGYPGVPPSVPVALTHGAHTIVMEYYERAGAARATLSWAVSTPASCGGTAAGWFGQYFSNITLTGPPAACRDDAAINFNWGGGAPVAGLPTDAFSVRWTRTQTFAAGVYNFALGTDDGGRLFIDGVLVLDRWVDQGYPTPQPNVTRSITEGPHTMVVEQYERGGDARATFVITPIKPPPAPTLAFTALTNAHWSGTGSTVFYRSTAAGSFTTTATSSDAAYPVTAYGFPALGARWTSTAGGLGVNTYSWTAAPAAPGTVNVTATNSAGAISAGTPLTLVDDVTGPTTGTLGYLDGTTAATSVTVDVTAGTDAGSGLATRLLQRQAATLTGSTCGSFGAFATLPNGTNPGATVTDTVALGSCYRYQHVMTDNVGNVTTNIGAGTTKVRKTYAATVIDTVGLLGYWRLGEPPATLTEPFGGTTGATLQSRNASWVRHPISSADTVFTAGGRLRKGGSGTNGALYWATAAPPSANYTVQADVFVASLVANDLAGVVGRLDTAATGGTFYAGVYDRAQQRWVLYRLVNGTQVAIGSSATTSLSAGLTYQVALEMNGSAIRLLVGGTQVISAVDTSITAPGRGGVVVGYGPATTTLSDTTGMHLDNVIVRALPAAMLDSKGLNTGTYFNGPTLGVTGAIVNDTNTAMTLEGLNDYGSVARQISGDFSIELWVKSTTGGIGTGNQWWEGAGLVDAEVGGAVNDFGVAMRGDGRVVAGVGNPDTSIVSTAGYKDGNWHHVVFTRTRATGALALYVDGTNAAPSGTGTTALLDAAPTMAFGRIQTGVNSFVGSLDEVAVYTTALTPATVAAHFNAGK